MAKKILLLGKRLILSTLDLKDVTDKYLKWLNSKDLQKFTRRRGKKISKKELYSFVKNFRKSEDIYLAIKIKQNYKHIGNIFLNYLDKTNRNADLSIMIGDKDEQGKGYASEAIDTLSKYAFTTLNLHRLYASSPNPAFNSMIKKVGWILEGKSRQSFNINGRFLDVYCWSILKNEWKRLKRGK
jgi:RimJ/RimL family protein N-acetyltransferase